MVLKKMAARRIAYLENELQNTQNDLKASISDLETVNEELQAANEELYAVNAEYEQKLDELAATTNGLKTIPCVLHPTAQRKTASKVWFLRLSIALA